MGTECAHTSRVFRTRRRGSGPRWRNQTRSAIISSSSGSECSILCQRKCVHGQIIVRKAQLTGPGSARAVLGPHALPAEDT